MNINYIDTTSGYVYYIASPNNYLQKYLYRSKLDGSGVAEKSNPFCNFRVRVVINYLAMLNMQYIFLKMHKLLDNTT
jgi:hypothetical protein